MPGVLFSLFDFAMGIAGWCVALFPFGLALMSSFGSGKWLR